MTTKFRWTLGFVLLLIGLVRPPALQAKDNELHFFVGATDRVGSTVQGPDLAFQSSGALVGLRYFRRLEGPVFAGGAFAFSNAGRNSSILFFDGSPVVLSDILFLLPVSGGSTFLFEGALRIDLSSAKRFAPYLAVSAGGVHRTRLLSTGELSVFLESDTFAGFTSLPLGTFIDKGNTDFLVAAGGGVRFRVGERWGIRGEFRARNDRWTSLEFFGGPFIEF